MKKSLIFIGLVIVFIASLFAGCATSRPYVGHGWTAYDYYDAGIVNLDYHAYDNALYYFDQAEILFQRENNTSGLILTYMRIGEVHYIRNEYSDAVYYFTNVIEIDDSVWKAWANLALCYSEQKYTEKCLTALNVVIIAGEKEGADWFKENMDLFVWLEGNAEYNDIVSLALLY